MYGKDIYFFPLLLDLFFICISNVISFPGLPSRNSLSHPPSPTQPPTPAFPPWHSPTLRHRSSQDQRPLLPLISNKGHPLTHPLASTMGPSMCTLWLVIQSPGTPRGGGSCQLTLLLPPRGSKAPQLLHSLLQLLHLGPHAQSKG